MQESFSEYINIEDEKTQELSFNFLKSVEASSCALQNYVPYLKWIKSITFMNISVKLDLRGQCYNFIAGDRSFS